MGCGSSKATRIGSEDTETGPDNNNYSENETKKEVRAARADISGLPGSVPDSSSTDGSLVSTTATHSSAGREPVAFTVGGDTEPDASLIRRHPPLRFRRLEDQQVEISQEKINMKQADAERRRSAVGCILILHRIFCKHKTNPAPD